MIEREGDLFTTDQRAIGHGVNCQGVMGAGIAKAFRTFYPTNYGVYKGQCQVGGLNPGGVLIVPEHDQEWNGVYTEATEPRLIVNLATQQYPGPNAAYPWVSDSIAKAVDQLIGLGVRSMALPQIGCGIGGLEWNRVEEILLTEEWFRSKTKKPFEFEVWTYKE